MSFPSGIGAVDLMIGFPFKDKRAIYEYLRKGIKDTQSKDEYDFPVEYMSDLMRRARSCVVPRSMASCGTWMSALSSTLPLRSMTGMEMFVVCDSS